MENSPEMTQRSGRTVGGKVLLGLEQVQNMARAMWEVQGLTVPDIARQVSKSVSAVEKWKAKQGWLKKTELAGELQELTKQKFLNQLADAGMPSERAAKLLITGMTRPRQDQISETDPKTGRTKMTFRGNPDYKTRHKYLHDYLLVAGVAGSPERQAGPGQGGSINIQVNIPEKR